MLDIAREQNIIWNRHGAEQIEELTDYFSWKWELQ